MYPYQCKWLECRLVAPGESIIVGGRFRRIDAIAEGNRSERNIWFDLQCGNPLSAATVPKSGPVSGLDYSNNVNDDFKKISFRCRTKTYMLGFRAKLTGKVFSVAKTISRRTGPGRKLPVLYNEIIIGIGNNYCNNSRRRRVRGHFT